MTEKQVIRLIVAAKAAADEIERLKYLFLPYYEGKIGEPDLDVLEALRKALLPAKGV